MRDRGRLHQRGLADRQRVRHREQLRGGSRDVARVRAAEVEVVGERAVEAHRRAAGEARPALAAAGRRPAHDAVADSPSRRRRRRARRSCPPIRAPARCRVGRCARAPGARRCRRSRTAPTSTSTSRGPTSGTATCCTSSTPSPTYTLASMTSIGARSPRSRGSPDTTHVARETVGDDQVHPGVQGSGQGDARPAPPTRAVRHRQAVAGALGRGRRRRSTPPTGRSPSRACVEQPTTWTWDEMHALPPSTYAGDIHCVTTWSKLGMEFEGVSVDTLLAAARPRADASHVLAFSSTGYTTNLPLADVTDGKAWVAFTADGAAAVTRPRRSRPPPRAAPLLLEERQVGLRPAGARPRRTRLLGAQRLPRPRRSLARAALPGRLTVPAVWQTATVVAIRDETSTREDVPAAPRRADRTPGRPALRRAAHRTRRVHRVALVLGRARPRTAAEIELTVERLDDGEVSTFLHDVVEVGDELEVRGPIGGYFVWDGTTPALLLGGGSGLVPLMAMVRLARATGVSPPRRPRAPGRVGALARRPLLRRRAARPRRRHRRVHARHAPGGPDRPVDSPPPTSTPLLRDDQTVYVCGSALFTDAVGDLLLDLGVAAERGRTFERFGPAA